MDTRERIMADIETMLQAHRRTAHVDPYYAGSGYGFNSWYVDFATHGKCNLEAVVKSADHAFELFVHGTIDEDEYLYWKLHFKKKQLTPQQEMLERIRSKPKMKQAFTRLKPWE